MSDELRVQHAPFGYPSCRPCGERHQPPECPVDSEGRSLAPCGCAWPILEAAEDYPAAHYADSCHIVRERIFDRLRETVGPDQFEQVRDLVKAELEMTRTQTAITIAKSIEASRPRIPPEGAGAVGYDMGLTKAITLAHVVASSAVPPKEG